MAGKTSYPSEFHAAQGKRLLGRTQGAELSDDVWMPRSQMPGWVPYFAITSWVSVGQLLNSFEPQFPYMSHEDSNTHHKADELIKRE